MITLYSYYDKVLKTADDVENALELYRGLAKRTPSRILEHYGPILETLTQLLANRSRRANIAFE